MIPQDKVKDVLITRTAIKTLKPEQWVEKVISFQFKDARNFVREADEIEISGFGTFIRSKAKLKRKIANLENAIMNIEKGLEDSTKTPEQIALLREKGEGSRETLIFLKQKLQDYENRLERDSRGNKE